MALLVALFIVVPLAELAVIAAVADRMGLGDTIAVLLLVSLVGAALVKREGLAAVGRINQRLAAGELPGRELTDGAMVLVAGALLLTPGFLTDAAGFLLLLPPTRPLVRRLATRWFRHRVDVRVAGGGRRAGSAWGVVIDADADVADGRASGETVGEVIDVEIVDDGGAEPPARG